MCRYGGALYIGSVNHRTTVSNCQILSNRAGNSGGGIFLSIHNTFLTIRSSTIAGNTAGGLVGSGGGGGGIYSDINDGLQILDVILDSNTAGGSGGGIYLNGDHSAVSLYSIRMTGNQAVGGSGGSIGAAARLIDSNIRSVTIISSMSNTSGGAMSLHYAENVVLTSVTINRASSNYK